MSGLVRGTQGWVYYGGRKILRMNNWTMNPVAGVDDITHFHSSGAERAFTGVVDVTGSLSGNYELLDTSTGSTGGAPTRSPVLNILRTMMTSTSPLAENRAKFIESSQSMFWGNILFTDVGKNQPAQGNQTITLNWASNGRLRWKNATTT